MKCFYVLITLCIALSCIHPTAKGQLNCQSELMPGGSLKGVDDTVHAFKVWDPDGSGPLGAQLFMGGYFGVAGPHYSPCIASYDLATGAWRGLGTNMSGFLSQGVRAIEVMTNGDLVIGGEFTLSGSGQGYPIAKWTGTIWQPLGGNASSIVQSLLALPNGDLIAGGNFSTIGSVAAPSIARWNGVSWSSMPGWTGGSVQCLALTSNGSVIASGTNSVGRWNGSAWTMLTLPPSVTQINDCVVLPNGNIVIGGNFAAASHILSWNGSAWTAMGAGFNGSVTDLLVLSNGQLRANGSFTNSGTTILPQCAVWNGSAWSVPSAAIGTSSTPCMTELPDGSFVIQSGFGSTGRVMRSTTTGWESLRGDIEGEVFTFDNTPSGEVLAAGSFTTIGGIPAANIAKWDGTSWSAIGIPNINPPRAITGWNGNNFVAGSQYELKVWNGSTWQNFQSFSGPNFGSNQLTTEQGAFALLAAQNGDLYVAGSFSSIYGVSANSIARWNGTTWTPMGAGLRGAVFDLEALPNGTILAGGSFTASGSTPLPSLVAWNGTSWSSSGIYDEDTSNVIRDIFVENNEDIWVAGYLLRASASSPWTPLLRRHNGEWTGIAVLPSQGTAYSVSKMPNGDMVVGGLNFVAVRRGLTWSSQNVNGIAYSTVVQNDGKCLVGGSFTTFRQNGQRIGSARLLRVGVPEGCAHCDSIDFNNDGSLFDPQDLLAFVSVYSEGPCVPAIAACNDIDFNNDTSVFDPCDIDSFLLVYSEGVCTLCGE